jgi:hypothetical protein
MKIVPQRTSETENGKDAESTADMANKDDQKVPARRERIVRGSRTRPIQGYDRKDIV